MINITNIFLRVVVLSVVILVAMGLVVDDGGWCSRGQITVIASVSECRYL